MESLIECFSDRLCRSAAGFAMAGVIAMLTAAALLLLALHVWRLRPSDPSVPEAVPEELTTEAALRNDVRPRRAAGGSR